MTASTVVVCITEDTCRTRRMTSLAPAGRTDRVFVVVHCLKLDQGVLAIVACQLARVWVRRTVEEAHIADLTLGGIVRLAA